MLVGREAEQRRLAELVAGARIRRSGVLVLSGEAGIGKTALLEDTARHAGSMQVLSISGNEHESDLGFAALHQLLTPAISLIARIPEPQADALAVALMLRSGPAPERFAVGVAALTLLSRFAEDAPVLVLIDDAHLLDAPSAAAIAFVARRLVADPIAMVIARRPEPDAPLHNTGLPVLELPGLDLGAAATLVAASTGALPDLDDARELHRLTAGNPLGLVELAADVGVSRHLPGMPVPVPETVAHAFARRVSALSASAQRVLLIAAIADGDLSLTSRAAMEFGGDIAALADAESVGLIALRDGRADFRHPLVRSAVYTIADPVLRRKAHRAVADAMPLHELDRRAWHHSAACVGVDDTVAAALAGVAERAAVRGAHAAAVAAYSRAAELYEHHDSRSAMLARAGEAAWLAGHLRDADDLLSAAAKQTSDPAESAAIDGMRGNLALRTGSLRDAHKLLTEAARRIENVNPDGAVMLFADTVSAAFYLCNSEIARKSADTLERLLGRCETDESNIRGQTAIGMARILAGEDGIPWLRRAVAALTDRPDRYDPRRPDWSVIGTLFLRESTAGRDLVDRIVTDQRTRTALGALPNLLFHVARDDATTERWSAAVVGFDESIALSRETAQTTDLAVSLAGLAWVQARTGRIDDCATNCREALALAARHDIMLAKVWAQFATGDALFGAGDARGAAAAYLDLVATLKAVGMRDVDVNPAPELVEALLRMGDHDAAASTAATYLAAAREKGQPWALARAARAAALVASDADAREARFEQAIELHRDNPDVFEEARTRLAYGASLRRDRRRVAARPHLRSALQQFERLGARPWADFAATELAATGEQARRVGDRYLAALTSQELQIAQLLGGGSTTKEAAAALFLSPKTVEYHLRRVYQKLGISSRSELGAALHDPPLSAPQGTSTTEPTVLRP